MEAKKYLIGGKELAEFFGITEQAIYKLIERGMPGPTNKKFNLKECTRWYISDLKEKAKGHGKKDSIEQARKNLYKIKAARERITKAKEELELALRSEKAISLDLVQQEWEQLSTVLANRFKTLDFDIMSALSLDNEGRERVRECIRQALDAIPEEYMKRKGKQAKT